MRVLILSSWYPNALNPVKGLFVREQARALVQGGLEVAVVYPFDEALPAGEEQYAEEEGIPTWRANSLSAGPHSLTTDTNSLSGRSSRYRAWVNRYLARIGSYRRSINLLQRVTEKFQPDIMHVHVGYPAAIIAYFFTRKHKLPYVITEHMSYLQDYIAKWQHRILLKPAFQKAVMVLPVSPALAGQLEDLGWQLALRSVPNVVDTKRFTPVAIPEVRRAFEDGGNEVREPGKSGDEVREPRGSHAGLTAHVGSDVWSLRILFVGGMDETEVKGLQFLLPAFAGFAKDFPARLELIGDGAFRRHYEALARELGLEDSCRFRGAVPPDKMPDHYRRSHFLVLSSLKETFGCVLIEAMASGIPVLATACGGPESIVTAETGLLVKPGSSEALLAGLKEMAQKCAHYDPLALRDYTERHFGPQAWAEELKEIYRQACKEVRK